VLQDELTEEGVDDAAADQLERPPAHPLQVVERLGATEIGQLPPSGPGRLRGVVDCHQLRPQRLDAGTAHADPEVLEGRDVAEVPDERAQQRAVHPLEVVGRDRLDQRERSLACLAERARVVLRGQRQGPSGGRCLLGDRMHGRGCPVRLAESLARYTRWRVGSTR
jgi:hypothetical protein